MVVCPRTAELRNRSVIPSGENTRALLLSLTKTLEERGLRTLKTTKRPGIPLHLSRVHHLLRNRYYAGKVTFKDVEYDSKHQPLVSEAQFETVQAVLRSHDFGEKQRKYDH
jgi:site-specific DNA recombinase